VSLVEIFTNSRDMSRTVENSLCCNVET